MLRRQRGNEAFFAGRAKDFFEVGRMKDNTKGMLLMLICPTIWSLSGLIAKVVPWPGICIAGFRGVLSGLTIYVYMRIMQIKPVFTWRTFFTGLTVTGTLLSYFASLKLIPAANAVALQYTEPVFLLVLNAVFLKQKYRRADYAVVGMALLGVALLFMDGGLSDLGGSLLALLSGLFYGMTYFLLTDRPTEERLTGLLIGNTLAFVGIFTTDLSTLSISLPIVLIVLVSGLFQIAVPHIILTKAMKLTTPLACSLIATLEMVLNPIWVYIFIGEKPSARALLGCVVIMAAVLIWCVYTARKEHDALAAEALLEEKV